MPRSVLNFMFGLDALERADARPSGITADANVNRVASIFREALDSAAFIDRAQLNGVYAGLGDHFLDDAVRHMRAVVRVADARDDAAVQEAMTSVALWLRWWNANRKNALALIANRYSR
ncbi:MAG: hypothetical protein DMG36_20980 [Acidobacteria bacterium]|nr:MAG: hypothetical protein DMG36_20980 [Acidobacteriota bacterium]